MLEPLFWLGLSILLVAASLTAVLVAAIPALQELARAARSAEKLFDTLSRELPPTLEAIRTTGLEITDLTDDVSEGVKSASQVVQQVDQSIDGAKKQAQNLQVGTRSIFVGVKTAWKTFTRQKPTRRTVERLPPTEQSSLTLRERETAKPENRRPKAEAYSTNDGYNESSNWDNDMDEEEFF
ncbi:DUF948 domain-containing protein [Nostoc sp. TCL26-01]|uniref:DUF948 domain-containing protein n=1 Tax=Nostoc sp. TCL26-01 TaxID=2576904 RepID=UPI0015BE31AD|nr:DUF948 domain-containing protein [Nostoc sp. TCL26-01]QLE57555.1 DUF948 domain-containing protein [Nostoc sp. TCL26-01]